MDWDKRMKIEGLLERAKCDRERLLILASSLDDQDVKIVLLYLHNAVAGAGKGDTMRGRCNINPRDRRDRPKSRRPWPVFPWN